MKEYLVFGNNARSYLKGGLIAFASIVILGGGFLTLKGPSLVKGMARASLERNLAPLGVKQIEIDTINFGWGRFYLRDIHSTSKPFEPSINIQEMDVAISAFFKVKAIDVVGATLELKEGDELSFSKSDLQDKAARLGKIINHVKELKLPTVSMRDCLLIIPSSQGSIKLPIHAVTETTVMRNQVLTIDWGEYGDNQFSGQFVMDLGRKGITIDVHTANIDIKTPTFQIKAPEISLWASTVSDGGEGYKVDGYAKLENLMLERYGSLKTPLEVNLEGEGTPDNLVLDELSITTTGVEKNLLELEGNFKPNQASGQIILTTQIAQLSQLWDFTPLLATHAADNVFVGGKFNITSEILWEKGKLKTSVLAVDVKGGSVAREGFSIEGANTQILFSTLKPLTTNGDQRVTATKLSIAGIDLRNVNFQCLFDTDGLFQIKQFSAETLQGNLKAHRFQRFVKGSHPAFQFETDFENIELADILKLTDLSSLSGRAKLAGNASMSYTLDDGLDILQAEVHSISNTGLIQYKPEGMRGESGPLGQKEANMAFQVLDNLNFTVFNVRLEHAADNPSEMQGIVKMLGSNPKVLNGYPFEFNIVTTGKLKDLVMNTLQHMKPPTDLKELNKAIKATKEAKEAKLARANQEVIEAKVSQEEAEPAEARLAKVAQETADQEAKEAKAIQEAAKEVEAKAKIAKAEQEAKEAKAIQEAAKEVEAKAKIAKAEQEAKEAKAIQEAAKEVEAKAKLAKADQEAKEAKAIQEAAKEVEAKAKIAKADQEAKEAKAIQEAAKEVEAKAKLAKAEQEAKEAKAIQEAAKEVEAKAKLAKADQEAKEAKAIQEAPKEVEAKAKEAKSTEIANVPKVAKKAKSGKKAKRSKSTKARRAIKRSKKAKNVKATETVKQEDRKLSDG